MKDPISEVTNKTPSVGVVEVVAEKETIVQKVTKKIKK